MGTSLEYCLTVHFTRASFPRNSIPVIYRKGQNLRPPVRVRARVKWPSLQRTRCQGIQCLSLNSSATPVRTKMSILSRRWI